VRSIGLKSVYLDKSIVRSDTRVTLFFILIFLAVAELPLFFFRGDPVGLYDIYLITLFFVVGFFDGFRVGRYKPLIVAYASYLAYLSFSLIFTTSAFSVLLLIKQVEHLLLLILLADFLERGTVSETRDIDRIILLFAFVIIYQIGYVRGIFPGIGVQYRLGLPFADGTSSNPAGFYLGIFVLFLYELALTRHKITVFRIFVLLLALYALWLTVSRVNFLALICVLGISFLHSFSRSKRGLVFLAFIGAGVVLLYAVVLPNLPYMGNFENILKILRDPREIFTDSSFTFRSAYHWPNAIRVWLSSPWTFLFGIGYGKIPVVDGSYHRLLANQGLVGFIMFAWFWFYSTLRLRISKPVIMVLLFIAINGITSDTLISSYRSVQIYLVLLFLLIQFDQLVEGRGNNDR
jgi:hypothetical protein